MPKNAEEAGKQRKMAKDIRYRSLAQFSEYPNEFDVQMASGVFSNLQGVRGFEIYGSEQHQIHKKAVKYDIIGRHVLDYDSCD